MATKVSDMLIAVVIIGILSGTFVLLMTAGTTKYGVTYSNQTLTLLNKVQTIQNQTQSLEQSLQPQTNNNLFDIFGQLFSQGYSSLKLLVSTTTLLPELVAVSIGAMGLGPASALIINGIIVILSIVIVIGVLLRVLLKEEI